MNGKGFNCSDNSANIEKILKDASSVYFGLPMLSMCDGMTIPLLGIIKKIWPNIQFVVTGVLGPQSNAHGPN
jgi:hypothetical protein